MKKPTRKQETSPRVLKRSELGRIRGGDSGGIMAMDDWETPVAATAGNKVWQDDWLAPT